MAESMGTECSLQLSKKRRAQKQYNNIDPRDRDRVISFCENLAKRTGKELSPQPGQTSSSVSCIMHPAGRQSFFLALATSFPAGE